MTMQAMVDYLKSKGFKVDKKYKHTTIEYEFHIEKDGNHMVSYFKYPENVLPDEKNKRQEDFLDALLTAFEKEFGVQDAYLEQIEDRIRSHVIIRGFSVAVTKQDSLYHIILYKKGRQRSYAFHRDDPLSNTFEKLMKRVVWMMDELDYDIGLINYCNHDVEVTKEMWTTHNPFIEKRYGIKNVIFNNPATIVLWTDGTKTVVKAENESFDPEKGLAMAISKKALGNQGNYYNVFTKWLPEEKTGNVTVKFSCKTDKKKLEKIARSFNETAAKAKQMAEDMKKVVSEGVKKSWEDYHD